MMIMVDIKSQEIENHYWTQLDDVSKRVLNLMPYEVDALVDQLSKVTPEIFLSFLEDPKDEWNLLCKRPDFRQLIKYYESHKEKFFE